MADQNKKNQQEPEIKEAHPISQFLARTGALLR